MPQDQTDLFGLKKTFKAASNQHRGMRFLAVYLGLAFLVGFLGLVSLAPQVGEKLGTLSVKKQTQESQATYFNPKGPCYPYGDVNYDGLVNATDSQQILKVVAGTIQFKSDPKYADVDADGKVTSVDALLIQRYIAGLITTKPEWPVCRKASSSPSSSPWTWPNR
ncbi:hypothetical protein HY382_03125 [Candidatus Curtissbacteria bacterium]|nr:hypothetical protein [Candidatus Curtissbacteria bacterium]